MTVALADDGVKLKYRTVGAGPLNLLFMHGWAGTGDYFNEVVDTMDLSGLRVTTLDLRGHGGSDKPQTGYGLDRLARDVFAVADAAGAHRFVLVGFSMSAKFAQYVACQNPARVTGLALVGGCPACEIPFPAELQHDWVSRVGDKERLRELISQFMARPVERAVFDRFLAEAARVPAAALDETITSCVRTSFTAEASALRMPVLVVGGRHDPIFTPEALRAGMRQALPHARLVFLDCSHEIPMECPRELAGLIEAFLAGVAAP